MTNKSSRKRTEYGVKGIIKEIILYTMNGKRQTLSCIFVQFRRENPTCFWRWEGGGDRMEARRPWNNAFKIVMTIILKLQFCTLPNWQTNASTE